MGNNKIIFFTRQKLLTLGLKNLISPLDKNLTVEMEGEIENLSNGALIIVDNSLPPEEIPINYPKKFKKLKKNNPYIPIILYTRETLINTDYLFNIGINAIVYQNRKDSHKILLSYIDLLLKHPSIIIRDNVSRLEHFELKEKELEILNLICQGMRNKDIAQSLCLSVPTVEGYISKIYEKLDVSSRVEAAIKAILLNMVSYEVLEAYMSVHPPSTTRL